MLESTNLDYWTRKFGVTKRQLDGAVEAVGTSARAVEEYLRRAGLHTRRPA